MVRVQIKTELLRWARERAGLSAEQLAKRFPRLSEWESGDVQPTLKQVERYAEATHAPVGYLFLAEPPIEQIPIPDFRTIGNEYIGHPSPDLLDTVYLCQQRQEWYHGFARMIGEDPLAFVGSTTVTADITEAAGRIRSALGFSVEARRRLRTWTDALRLFIEQAEAAGVLVMCSGVVGNNNRRALDPDEFRGFALVDDLAPLVFINGADTKAAQMFTLAHELAHIWLGETGLSDSQPVWIPDQGVERWCNRVAAELLVPITSLRGEYSERAPINTEANRLARFYKVSSLVILRRIFDIGGMNRREFSEAYEAELDRLLGLPRGAGGNFYLTQAARVSKRFARAIVINTLEGQTLHRDAFRMLGVSKQETFRRLGQSLGLTI